MTFAIRSSSRKLVYALKGFATFWEFSFYGQKKVADYEYHSLFADNSFSFSKERYY